MSKPNLYKGKDFGSNEYGHSKSNDGANNGISNPMCTKINSSKHCK